MAESAQDIDFPPEGDVAEYLSSTLPAFVGLADRAGLELVAFLLKMASDAANEAAGEKATRSGRASPKARSGARRAR